MSISAPHARAQQGEFDRHRSDNQEQQGQEPQRHTQQQFPRQHRPYHQNHRCLADALQLSVRVQTAKIGFAEIHQDLAGSDSILRSLDSMTGSESGALASAPNIT
jgi:hypothetical protein